MAKAFGWKLFHWLGYTLLASCRAIGVCLFGNCSSNVIMKPANKLVPLEALSTLMQPKGNTSFAWVPPKKEKKVYTNPRRGQQGMHTHFHQWESANCVLFAAHTKQKYCLLLFFPPYLPHFPGPICVVEVPIHTHFGAAHYTLWALQVPVHTHFDAAHYTLWDLEVPIHTYFDAAHHTLWALEVARHTFWCCPLHNLSPRGAHTHILVLPIAHFEP